MKSLRITSKSPVHMLIGVLAAAFTAGAYHLHSSSISWVINLIDDRWIYPLTGTFVTLYAGMTFIAWINAYYQQSRWIAFIALGKLRREIRRVISIIFGFGATCSLIGTIENDPKAASLGLLCLIVIGIFLCFLEFSIFLMQDKTLKKKQYAYQSILVALIAIPVADVGYIAAKSMLGA